MRGWAARLIVLTLATAGCISTTPGAIDAASTPYTPSLPELDLGEIIELNVPVAGARLHGTVYLPDVPDGEKVPVIMDMGPYYGNLGSDTSVYSKSHPPNLLYEHFLRRGYAIALMSVRGTGQSSGCFMIGGPQERADVAAAVEHLAAQEWSNGNVAMTGVSYDGTTPWEGLVSGAAPSLKAIIPVEGISDFYRYSFFEGVPVGGGAAFNTYYEAMVDVAFTNPAGLPPWVAAQPSNLCPEQADVYLTPYQTYRDGVHGAYWDARDMSAMLADATAAVFVVHGFKDFNVKMDHVQTIWDDLPGPKRMLLGQWAHNIPWRNSYDKEQSWHEYNATMDAFLDAYLKGDAAALAAQQAAAPVLVQDSANTTWELTAWPPVESIDTPFYLASDGAMATTPADEGRATLRSNPARLALIAAGAPIAPQGGARFVTEPVAADTILMGNPYADLNVTVDRPEGRLQVSLYEVDGDEWELISLGWQNLATRESRDKASDVPTGTPLQVRVLLEGLAQVIEKGHSVAFVIEPENMESLTPHVQTTTFTIQLGGEDGAKLVLPIFHDD